MKKSEAIKLIRDVIKIEPVFEMDDYSRNYIKASNVLELLMSLGFKQPKIPKIDDTGTNSFMSHEWEDE